MNVMDIPGSQPAVRKQLSFNTRDIMNITDIEGTRPTKQDPMLRFSRSQVPRAQLNN